MGDTEKDWFTNFGPEDLVHEHDALTSETSWTFDSVSVKGDDGQWKRAPLTFGTLTPSTLVSLGARHHAGLSSPR